MSFDDHQDQVLTTAVASLILGVSRQRVRQMLKARLLLGQKVGRDWHIPATEVGRILAAKAGQETLPGLSGGKNGK